VRPVSNGPEVIVFDITCPVRGFDETIAIAHEKLAAIKKRFYEESEAALD
jgi:hypothetical protein